MTLSVHPLESSNSPLEQNEPLSFINPDNSPPIPRQQQRAYSVTGMPNELQIKDEQQRQRSNQPWWQYYYQLYHYHLPPGRKPTVFGPYLLLQTLGEGEFGKVKFGIEVKTGQEVAIKLMRKDSIDSTSRMTKVEREISVLRVLHHPNIVELYDVIETEKYIGIILQCATGGELFDYILAHRYLREKDASRLFAQLISGVHYMHQKQIVHRDLKLENLLLDRHRNVLITDFGFANQFASPQDDLMSTSCGSPCYAAPELVMNQGCYVGPAVDIWSCGVILFAMLCGYLPYDDDPANPESYNINLLYKYILNTPLVFPDYISEEACDLMSLMLVPDPEKRCTMDIIMAHPWLSPHSHIFDHVEQQLALDREKQKQEEQEKEEILEAQIPRRNTVGPAQYVQEDAVVPDMDVQMKEPVKEKEPVVLEKEEEEEVAQGSLSPLPTISPSTSTKRPKSVAVSTEKVLHFLSGQTTTPTTGHTNDVRTRHMSLVEETKPSILQSKYISSVNQQRKPQTPTSPKPNVSASTPYPTNKSTPAPPNHKRQVRLSTITPSPPNDRGTRRKTLSLLVNSMTDNTKMPFARRQSNARPTEDQVKAQMMPSISEHTMSDKEKHRSAGKKIMDWFKKKPLSTIHKSNNPSHDTVLENQAESNSIPTDDHDIKLRTHHGAVDQEALTSRHPVQVFNEVKMALASLGLEAKRDGSEFKLKCARPKKSLMEKKRKSTPPILNHHQPHPYQQQHNNGIRMLLQRRSSAANQESASTTDEAIKTIYGDANVDPGDEVRFSVELCKIKNLPGLYIVDMRRLRGNVWAYKFIYRTLMDTLKLGGKSEYLNTTQKTVKPTPPVKSETPKHEPIIESIPEDKSNTIVMDHTPPISNTREIAV